MKLIIVRYGRERAHDDPEQAAGFRPAEKIAGVPGLVWKLWGYDDAQRVATSIYPFDSESNAERGAMAHAGLSAFPGITNIEVSYLDADQDLSTVTRAPMQAGQPV